MDKKEFMAEIMKVNSTDTDESTEALVRLEQFYTDHETAYNELNERFNTEHEARKKLALRYAERATEEQVLSPEEIEEKENTELVNRVNEHFGV